MPIRIGFLFNHDQIHQVAHSLPIALALAGHASGTEIIVATTNPRLLQEVTRLTGTQRPSLLQEGLLHDGLSPEGLQIISLSLTKWPSRLAAYLLDWLLPATKILIYRDNLPFFQSLDVLVVAEKTSLLLKTRYHLDRLKIVHTRHGAGDRAIGFDAASAQFDHTLVSGAKIRDRLIAEAKVDPARITIVGYPKFDLPPTPANTLAVPNDGRPIVLYNPHVSPHLSSWYEQGRAVLDWFMAHDEYFLIFAPHVMLFERDLVVSIDRMRIDRPGRIDKRFLRAPNIHIDLGSMLSTTMAYTDRADIYLGDVSSQVYEFIVRPRPCVFIDAHGVAWENDRNYAHWQAGPVIRKAADLGPALVAARADHTARYAPIQQQLVEYSFDITAEPAAKRAARAVMAVALSVPGPIPAPARVHRG